MIRSIHNPRELLFHKAKRPHLQVRPSYHLVIVGGWYNHLHDIDRMVKHKFLLLIMDKMTH